MFLTLVIGLVSYVVISGMKTKKKKKNAAFDDRNVSSKEYIPQSSFTFHNELKKKKKIFFAN